MYKVISWPPQHHLVGTEKPVEILITLATAISVINSFLSLTQKPCLLPASMELWLVNLLARKQGTIPAPLTLSINLSFHFYFVFYFL